MFVYVLAAALFLSYSVALCINNTHRQTPRRKHARKQRMHSFQLNLSTCVYAWCCVSTDRRSMRAIGRIHAARLCVWCGLVFVCPITRRTAFRRDHAYAS